LRSYSLVYLFRPWSMPVIRVRRGIVCSTGLGAARLRCSLELYRSPRCDRGRRLSGLLCSRLPWSEAPRARRRRQRLRRYRLLHRRFRSPLPALTCSLRRDVIGLSCIRRRIRSRTAELTIWLTGGEDLDRYVTSLALHGSSPR